jgi:hypothetical protein
MYLLCSQRGSYEMVRSPFSIEGDDEDEDEYHDGTDGGASPPDAAGGAGGGPAKSSSGGKYKSNLSFADYSV